MLDYKHLIKKAKLTQTIVADDMGMSVRKLNDILNGRNEFKGNELERFLDIVGYDDGKNGNPEKSNLRIKELRKRAELSQGELAKKAGISLRAVSHYEKGDREPSASALLGISTALGVTIGELFGEERGKPAPAFVLETLQETNELLRDYAGQGTETIKKLAAKLADETGTDLGGQLMEIRGMVDRLMETNAKRNQRWMAIVKAGDAGNVPDASERYELMEDIAVLGKRVSELDGEITFLVG